MPASKRLRPCHDPERLGRRRAIELVGVRSRPAIDIVAAIGCALHDQIIAQPAIDRVSACPAIERVVARLRQRAYPPRSRW